MSRTVPRGFDIIDALLSPKEQVRLSSASKKMQQESDEAAHIKIKKTYPALNNRATYALLDFIKTQYPYSIDTFIVNDKVAQSFANASGESYLASYKALVKKYRNQPGSSSFINFYLVRYLNENASFRKQFDDALMSSNMDTIRAKEALLEGLIDWLAQVNISMNRDAPLYFPTKMREEWTQMHTQMRAKLEEIRLEYARYHIQIHNAEERRRETAERNASAHAQAAEVSGRGKGKGRAA